MPARLGNDARALEVTRDRLAGGADTSAEALKAAQERVDTLGILAGTAPAEGPGIVLTIDDPDGKVTSTLLLDALQELRDAGAEAVQIGDVRVVVDTYFTDTPTGIEVSGKRVRSPYVITAIGGSATMASAMDIPGGVNESVRRLGAVSTVDQRDDGLDHRIAHSRRASVRSPRPSRHRLGRLSTPHNPNISTRRAMSELEYPEDLRYTAEHEWVRAADGGVVRVGITSFAQDALGDVVYVSLPTVGDTVAVGDACGEVESTKSVSDLYAPLAGEVTAVNEALDATPELVNTDPYGEGWMYELRVEDPAALEGLLDQSAYRGQLG